MGKVRIQGRLGLEVRGRVMVSVHGPGAAVSLTNDGCTAQERKWEVKGLVGVVGVGSSCLLSKP